jgi:murein hydrolase activator
VESFAPRRLAKLVGLLALPLLIGAAANRELEGIKKKIETEKKGLSELKVKEGSVLQSLGKIESELGRRNRELKVADAKLNSLKSELARKQAEADELDRTITVRQVVFQQRAVALYRWQHSGNPLIILNGAESLGAVLQRKRYLQLALAYDQQLATELRAESEHQALVRQELADKRAELAGQKQVLGVAQAAVRREAENRKLMLASLRQEKETRAKALREMEMAALRLQKMLDEIARRAMSKPRESSPAPSPGTGFDAERGQLDWPVRGVVTAPFGKFKHPEFATEIIRKGIDIDAAPGEPIRAVEKGRVVYADRFSGYGKMIIVDHGQRYYTIYGHLGEMLKKNGDEVRRGEVLGRVGDGETPGGPTVYFEMRKDSRSVDPLAWLKK